MFKIIKNSKIKQYATVPFDEFINLLKYSSALVGNSSSGIIEAPYLHIPSINIGSRQAGRLRSSSVIDVGYDKKLIKNAINKTINDKKFLNKIKKSKSLYGDGHTAEKIIKILENTNLKKISTQKEMTY